MGLLRVIFALSVVIFHSGRFFNYNFNPRLAVLAFFMASGFYMALILDKKYVKNKFKFFLTNRFLRIYPLYWTVLLLTFLLTAAKFIFHIGDPDNAIEHYIRYAPAASPLIYITTIVNVIVRNITLVVTYDYFIPSNNTATYLLVLQAWTLQVEVLFYFLAPILNKISSRVLLLFLAIFVLVFYGIIEPNHILPILTLSYLFLSNLLFFILGTLSYKYIYKRIITQNLTKKISKYIFWLFLLYTLFYNFIPPKYILNYLNTVDFLYCILFTISMPFIFLYTNKNRIDKFLGELSYPIYVSHFLVIKLITNLATFKTDSNLRTVIIVVLVLGTSFLIVKLIEEPIDLIRQSRLGDRKFKRI